MTDDRPPQNIYDDPQFFAGYCTLERFGAGWDKAVEHPVFMALLPDVRGLRVLDLGCGMGQLAHHLAEAGAAEVVGVDISERMLALAHAERSHPRVIYFRDALETVSFPPGRVDLVVSSLAFHYVADYRDLIRRIAGWLTPGGVLVFSTEHPIYTAVDPSTGWVVDEAGRRLHWAIDNYSEEGLREQRWFTEGVQKYHRSFATLVNGLIEAGLIVDRVEEPVPTDDDLKRYPHYLDERRRPTFILIRAHLPRDMS